MYATAFDKGYMSRGIAMAQSLFDKSPSSTLTVLCLDLESEIGVRELLPESSVTILRLHDIGTDFLLSIRRDREYREFCWTLGAVLCNYLLAQGHNEVVYLDADICFFGDPEVPLNEARSGDVAAVEHRFPERLRHYEVNGKFNVQWVYFRNTPTGRTVAERWFSQCVQSCKYDPQNGVVGDQKYLDDWPEICPTFVVISHGGSGVAPWNHETYRPKKNGDQWTVCTGESLIFYHFHGLRIGQSGRVELAGSIYSEVTGLPQTLYEEYLSRLRSVELRIRHLSTTSDPERWTVSREGFVVRLRRALHFTRRVVEK